MVLRSPLTRLAFFFVLLVAVDIAFQFLSAYSRKAAPANLRPLVELIGGLALAAAVIATYRKLVASFENRSATEMTKAGFLGQAAAGFLLGSALFAAVIGILAMMSVAHFAGFGGIGGLPHLIAIGVASSVGEEVVFRGVVYRLLEERFGSGVAIAVSAAAFGSLHAANPGAGLIGATAIALESGVLLALAFAVTRSLWLPIWIHFGWSCAEGGIFGTAISGHNYDGLINTTLSGPEVLTGGQFGPEASAVAIVISLAASVALGLVALRRRHWIELGGLRDGRTMG